MMSVAVNSTSLPQGTVISDFPVGWATLILALVTLCSVIAYIYLTRRTLTEMRTQRGVLERQAETVQNQLDLITKPRIDFYIGRSSAFRNVNLPQSVVYVVVKNSNGGGVARDINVKVTNLAKPLPNNWASSTFVVLEAGEDKDAVVPAGTVSGQTLKINVTYKDDQRAHEYELERELVYP